MVIAIQSRTRIFPESHASFIPTIRNLSILDATTLNLAICGCVFFYDHTIDLDQLQSSLKVALDSYPQWGGRLQYSSCNAKAGRNYPRERLSLSYGSNTDPGVEVMVGHADQVMSSVVPPTNARGCWDTTEVVDYQTFLNMENPFGLNTIRDPEGVPCMKVQFTTFTSKGTAIAIGLAHPLADAQTLLNFASFWAGVNCALLCSTPMSTIKPIFNPSLLDASAAKDIDGLKANFSILERDDKLQMRRYDYWTSATPPCVQYAHLESTGLCEVNVTKHGLGWSAQVPAKTWDMGASVSHTKLFFSAEETHAIYQYLAADAKLRISHQDALLAHLWAAIIRARELPGGNAVALSAPVGVRHRLHPPLPASFVGSAMINTICATGVHTSTAEKDPAKDEADKATSIRKTLQQFDSENIAALLHRMRFEHGPHQRQSYFVGIDHVIATSWTGIGLDHVAFEPNVRPVWVEALMPNVDGMVQIMERCGNPNTQTSNGNSSIGKDKWWANGVTMSVRLRHDVMKRLVNDQRLRAFAWRHVELNNMSI